jgi:Ca2+-binding EF-hand superfamily protein
MAAPETSMDPPLPPGDDLASSISHVFNLIDSDRSGTLEKKELLKALVFDPDVSMALTKYPTIHVLGKPRHFKDALVKMDTEKNGHITLREFTVFTKGITMSENEKKLRAVFKMVDKHSHGKVDKKEVLKSLSLNFSVMDILEGIEELKHLLDPHHYEESFHEMDVEHHGYVTEDEFVQFARNHHVAMKEKEDAAALAKLVEDEEKKRLAEEKAAISDETEAALPLQEEEAPRQKEIAPKTEEEVAPKTEEKVAPKTEEEIARKTEESSSPAVEKIEGDVGVEKEKAQQDCVVKETNPEKQQVQHGAVPETKPDPASVPEPKVEANVAGNRNEAGVPPTAAEEEKEKIVEETLEAVDKMLEEAKRKTSDRKQSGKASYSNQMYLPTFSLTPSKPKRVLLPDGRKYRSRNELSPQKQREKSRKQERRRVYSPQKVQEKITWNRAPDVAPVHAPISLHLKDNAMLEAIEADNSRYAFTKMQKNRANKVTGLYRNSKNRSVASKGSRAFAKGDGGSPIPPLLAGANRHYGVKPSRPKRGGRPKKFKNGSRQLKEMDEFDQLVREASERPVASAPLSPQQWNALQIEMKARRMEIEAEMKGMRAKAVIEQAKLKRLFETGSNIMPRNSKLDQEIFKTVQMYEVKAKEAERKQQKARRAARKAHFEWLLSINDNAQTGIDNTLSEEVEEALVEASSVERKQFLAEKRRRERNQRHDLIAQYREREQVLFKSNKGRPRRPSAREEYEAELAKRKRLLQNKLKKAREKRENSGEPILVNI